MRDIVYSTSSAGTVTSVGFHTDVAPLVFDDYDPWGAHCFVCGRHTDHFAEHDAIVEAGLATYGDDGSVRLTDKWDEELASRLAQEEYRRLYGESTAV